MKKREKKKRKEKNVKCKRKIGKNVVLAHDHDELNVK